MTQFEDSPPHSASHSRRQFIKGAAVAALVSSAAGAGIALYQQPEATITVSEALPPPAPTFPSQVLPQDQAQLQAELDAAWQKLAESEAENLRLRSEIDGLQRRLETAESQLSVESESLRTANHELSATQTNLETVRGELTNALQESAVMAGLIKLYDSLDDVDLMTPLSAGLDGLHQSWEEMWTEMPTLAEGIDRVEARVSEFNADVPLFDNGRRWLSGRIERLARFKLNLEEILKETQEAVGPMLEMLWGWFNTVLKWLPFSLGENSIKVMENLAEIVDDIPAAKDGLVGELALPLDKWFGSEGEPGKTVIQTRLFDEITTAALPQARSLMTRTEETRDRFNSDLVHTLSPLMAQHRQREDAIEAYKESHASVLNRL